MTKDEAYKAWWHNEGSGIIPTPNEDMEEFAHRMTQIAWSKGAFKEREQILFAIKEVRGRSQEPVAWRVTYSKVIKALAAIVTVHTPDNLFDLDAIPRDPVMGLVQQIRVAIDGYEPPQRTWIGLTDEEVEKIIKSNMSLQMNLAGIRADFEAAHNIKE